MECTVCPNQLVTEEERKRGICNLCNSAVMDRPRYTDFDEEFYNEVAAQEAEEENEQGLLHVGEQADLEGQRLLCLQYGECPVHGDDYNSDCPTCIPF